METFGNLLKQASELDASMGIPVFVGVVIGGVLFFSAVGLAYDYVTKTGHFAPKEEN